MIDASNRELVITIYTNDNGPVDVEHIEVIAKARDNNWTLEQINEALSVCDRPAIAHQGRPDENN